MGRTLAQGRRNVKAGKMAGKMAWPQPVHGIPSGVRQGNDYDGEKSGGGFPSAAEKTNGQAYSTLSILALNQFMLDWLLESFLMASHSFWFLIHQKYCWGSWSLPFLIC